MPKCYRTPNGTPYEYTVESYGSSRDSSDEYLTDISREHLGCSCPRDDYVMRPMRKHAGVTPDTICKHLQLAMAQAWIDNHINNTQK